MKRTLILLSFLSSCGYQWQPTELSTLSVPFIKGDDNGQLTTEIIHTLASSSTAKLCSSGGEYELNIEIVSQASDLIGFRINPQKINGEVKNNLRPTEGRKVMSVDVSLSRLGEVVFGPYRVSAYSEYDYVDGDSVEDLTFINRSGEQITVLPFSLGQLEPLEAAQEGALKPLYTRLAQKISDILACRDAQGFPIPSRTPP